MMVPRNQSLVAATAIIAGLLTAFEPVPGALASPLSVARSAMQTDEGWIEEIAFRGGGFRGGGGFHAGGFRGGAAFHGGANFNRNFSGNINRNVNVNRNVNRSVSRNVNVNRNVVRTGAWARPGRYWWPRGGAIAAGAAIGFVTAATAVAWAGAAPAPGMCWYYTDPSQRQGFWDYCQ
jgi:hypothetical protein